VPESVYVYTLASGTLEERPIDTVYGVKDLYKDASNTDNVYKIEQDLKNLGNHAARVVANIHAALPTGTFRIKRRDLNYLRKFMFVMDFRQIILSTQYLFKDEPGAPFGDAWLHSYRERHGLKSATDEWMRSLRYYLSTPHRQILLDAHGTMQKYGGEWEYHLNVSLNGPIPDDNIDAIEYFSQASGVCLGIWEAADGEEFVLGDNSFGLFQDLVGDISAGHQFFLFSPKVLVVLSRNLLTLEAFEDVQIPAHVRNAINSFFGIPIHATVLEYRDSKHVSNLSLTQLDQCLAAGFADDVFKFQITKLTPAQTYAVNHVLMINVGPSGSITFTSKEQMVWALWPFILKSCEMRRRQDVDRYLPLLLHLVPSLPRDLGDQIFEEFDETINLPLSTVAVTIITKIALLFVEILVVIVLRGWSSQIRR
jgi:hypothetical protein